MDGCVAASTNWNLIAGIDVAKAIQTKVPTTEDFVRPHLDDILSTERAILLSSGTDTNQPTCEFTIRVFPKYKIDSLTLVCTSSKIEVFSGKQSEYVETIYGERLEDDEECEDIDGYRYDIEILKSGVTHLMLKLMTNSNELCIYGVLLNVAPNPNGITTLLPNSINLDNVKEMLNNSNQKLSPSAEKCKIFLESYKNAMGFGMSRGNNDLIDDFQKRLHLRGTIEPDVDSKIETMDNATYANVLKKLEESESRIVKRLDAVEEVLNAKLDRILKMLQVKSEVAEV